MIAEDNDTIIDVVNDDADDINNDQKMSTDDLQSSLSKRKLTNSATMLNSEEQNQSEGAKRLCTTTSHQ